MRAPRAGLTNLVAMVKRKAAGETGAGSQGMHTPTNAHMEKAAACRHAAGGLKLKLVERDVTFGRKGNVLDVVSALDALGYKVIVLQRSNHLDNLLGRMSRRRTGVLHCKQRDGSGHSTQGRCDPAKLNMSVSLSCSRAAHWPPRLR